MLKSISTVAKTALTSVFAKLRKLGTGWQALYGCCVRLVLASLASYSGFIATAFAAAVPRRLLGAPEGKR